MVFPLYFPDSQYSHIVYSVIIHSPTGHITYIVPLPRPVTVTLLALGALAYLMHIRGRGGAHRSRQWVSILGRDDLNTYCK